MKKTILEMIIPFFISLGISIILWLYGQFFGGILAEFSWLHVFMILVLGTFAGYFIIDVILDLKKAFIYSPQKRSVDLKPKEDEKILFQSSNKDKSKPSDLVLIMIMLCVFLIMFGFLMYINAIFENTFYFYLSLSVFVLIIIFGILGMDVLLANNNASFYITNNRIVFVYGKGLFWNTRKNREILIKDLAFIQTRDKSLRFVKKRADGQDKYNGSEEKYKLFYIKRQYWIGFYLQNPLNSETTHKIISTLGNHIMVEKHPHLEEIWMCKDY